MSRAGRIATAARRHDRVRRLCAAQYDEQLDAFQSLLERGLGIGDRLAKTQEPMTTTLRQRGWVACDGWLGDALCASLREEVASLRAEGLFKQSYSEVAETGEKIWRDGVEAMELGPETWRSAPTLVAYVAEMMRELPAALNAQVDRLDLSATTFGHKLAVSTGDGSFYPKHLDNSLGLPHDNRKLTAILYLNPGWDERNGGALRLYDSITAPQHTDVAPSGDRLVLFWSDILVHEVLPCYETQEHGHRYTFTLWLTSDNPLVIANPTDPLHALREVHYPKRGSGG